MNEIHGDGTFSDGRGDALDRSLAHIAGDKDPRHTGFEEKGLARLPPGAGQLSFDVQIRSGEQKSIFVAQNAGATLLQSTA